MRRNATVLLAWAVLGTVTGPTHAGPVPWSYEWEPNPGTIKSDPVKTAGPNGHGRVTLSDGPVRHERGSGEIIAAWLGAHSDAAWSAPAHFTNAPYSLTLWLKDDRNGKSGKLVFGGLINGTLWKGGANLHNKWTSAQTQSLILGLDVFTVKIGPFLGPIAPNHGGIGAIGAFVTEHFLEPPPVFHAANLGGAPPVDAAPSPEPASGLLAALGAMLAGLTTWRKRRTDRRLMDGQLSA